jgi:hypothetical protein
MSSSNHARFATTINIDKMMERLGIDVGCQVAPRFGLLFSCAQRNCTTCRARETCTQWLATEIDGAIAPPKFCPSFDLLCELFYDSGVGHRTRSPNPVDRSRDDPWDRADAMP